MAKSIVKAMIDVLTDSPGLRRGEVFTAVCAHLANTHIQSITNSFVRHRIDGKLPVERTFFYRSTDGKWFVDVEKAQTWLHATNRNALIVVPPAAIKKQINQDAAGFCFDLGDAAGRVGVSVRTIVQAINSGKLTADFVEEPVATYVIANADIDRAFA